MAARKYEQDIRSSRTRLYVDGNTVRRVEEDHRQRESREVVDHRIKRNRERARHWNLMYLMMLAVATVATVMISYQYLQLRSSITAHRYNISALQTQVTNLKTSNDALEESLKICTDLNTVYTIATTELGMVYPSDDQVIEYEKSESEYVRQYEQIPTDD